MLLNSCATSSNNSYRLSEDLKKKDFPELLSVNDLFYVNDLNEDKSRVNRELILELLRYKSIDVSESNELIEDISNDLTPFGESIVKNISINTKRLEGAQPTNLAINIDEKYKNTLIQAAANIDAKINLIFVKDAENIVSKNILNEALPGFCNSFQLDQLNSIEEVIFSNNEFEQKETLIIYEKNFKNQERRLSNNFNNVRSVLFSNERYEEFASNVLGVAESTERYKKINALLPNIKINNIPRVRQDINNIYFLMSYKNFKFLLESLMMKMKHMQMNLLSS